MSRQGQQEHGQRRENQNIRTNTNQDNMYMEEELYQGYQEFYYQDDGHSYESIYDHIGNYNQQAEGNFYQGEHQEYGDY